MAVKQLVDIIKEVSEKTDIPFADCNLVVRYQWDKTHDAMKNYENRNIYLDKLGYIAVKRGKDAMYETVKSLINYLRFLRNGGKPRGWRKYSDTPELIEQKLRNLLKIKSEQAKIKNKKVTYYKARQDYKRMVLLPIEEGSEGREVSKDEIGDMFALPSKLKEFGEKD